MIHPPTSREFLKGSTPPIEVLPLGKSLLVSIESPEVS